jgi:sugar phosphate isomerase/epimerase
MPLVCAYSGNLARVPYTEMGGIVSDMGYDGVDLTVLPGGHVDPRLTNVDMMRAVEVVASARLELPMISTDITTTQNPTAYPVLYLANEAGVRYFRTGYWPQSIAVQARLTQAKQELLSVILLARRCNMFAMVPNKAGNFVGHNTAEMGRMIGDLDPNWVGVYFDIANVVADAGADGWETAFRTALPRMRAIALQDFTWKQQGEEKIIQMCPMGEGVVDWKKFFSLLASAKYNGPLSLHMEYATPDEPGAMARDLEFTRKQIEQAWSGVGTF